MPLRSPVAAVALAVALSAGVSAGAPVDVTPSPTAGAQPPTEPLLAAAERRAAVVPGSPSGATVLGSSRGHRLSGVETVARREPVHDYVRATEPRRYEHSSDAFDQDAAMLRCREALRTVRHLPLRFYRMSCAPTLRRGSSAAYTSLVGGNTYRSSEDVVIGSFLAPAATERIIRHEAAHAFVIEHRSVQYALERWAYPHRPDDELTGEIMDDPTPYPRSPSEVFAAAVARCGGAGPDPVVEDDRMSCAEAAAIERAALTTAPWPWGRAMTRRTLLP